MTSSLQDGVGAPSPAPPAYSPLTDAADPGNGERPSRESSVNATSDNHNGNHRRDPSPAQLPPSVNALLPPSDEMDIDVDPLPIPPVRVPATAFSSAIDAMNALANPETHDLYQQQPNAVLMALARLSAHRNQPIAMPPSTVRPANISFSHAMMESGSHGPQGQNNGTRYPQADAPLESFARIEFADSVFQMTTYAVIIGRDQRALQQARKDERRAEEYQRLRDERLQQGLPAPTPPAYDRKFSKSYVSEEGGMLGPESDGDDDPRPMRRKMSGTGGSASGESQLQQEAAAAQQAVEDEKNLIINRQYVSHSPGAAAVNLSALRPSPYHVPFIGIHSPGPQISTKTKAISREHLKIEFDPEQGVFKAIPLHKNGFFREDVHYKEESVVLKSGDRLQIKDVDFVFKINGVPHGMTGAEEDLEDEDASVARRYSEGGKEMSFEFESNHGQERPSTSDEEAQAEAAREETPSEASERAEEEPSQQLVETGVVETIEGDPEEERKAIKPETDLALLSDLLPMPPKKRGPGRPPKNGIMSKREERQRKKLLQELEKKNMPQLPPGEPPVKRKVGRPRKHPAPDDLLGRPEKRRYKPRKKNDEEGESDPEKAVKEKRREKPKTPPLELRREDYTDEQLQKPTKNYGALIDEVLTAAPDGLTLKQIYKRIAQKYPYFHFNSSTRGWESSVRHNLIGNDAFKKNDDTHLWWRVPGVDIDAGKKRKATSPDHPAAALQNFGQQYQPQNPAHAGAFRSEHASPANYHVGTAAQRPNYQASHSPGVMGHHPQHVATPHSAAHGQQLQRPSYPAAGQTAVPPQTAGYQDHSTSHPPQGATPGSSYSSPYASKLPSATPQPGVNPSGMHRQYAQPSNGPGPVNGLPQTSKLPTQSVIQPGPAAGKQPQPAAPVASPLPLKPAVSPELLKYVNNFKKLVTAQLEKRHATPDDVAMSVSMVPDAEALEEIILRALQPNLLQALISFKTSMIKTLERSLGPLKSERLILSAIDRGTEAEMSEYLKAENVLIPAIQKMVTEHQVKLAAAANAAATPPPKPAVYSPAPVATTKPALALAAPATVHQHVAQPVNQPVGQHDGQHPVPQAGAQRANQYTTQAMPQSVTQVAPQPVPQATYGAQVAPAPAAANPAPTAPATASTSTATPLLPAPAPNAATVALGMVPSTNPSRTSIPASAPITSPPPKTPPCGNKDEYRDDEAHFIAKIGVMRLLAVDDFVASNKLSQRTLVPGFTHAHNGPDKSEDKGRNSRRIQQGPRRIVPGLEVVHLKTPQALTEPKVLDSHNHDVGGRPVSKERKEVDKVGNELLSANDTKPGNGQEGHNGVDKAWDLANRPTELLDSQTDAVERDGHHTKTRYTEHGEQNFCERHWVKHHLDEEANPFVLVLVGGLPGWIVVQSRCGNCSDTHSEAGRKKDSKHGQASRLPPRSFYGEVDVKIRNDRSPRR
ncbi:hypothetical protein QBC34DRAFT_483302 [Podospora aff. communis PSN243]|uniref:Fork-head domain-containing protein n=1 Tax=Podospora aff. communis PSN243 TaxID=3040156 RepID=A0AAV9GVG0_9PEZI|nr:hypothetical protein QBC34DRAFT_483302 [Podospora aff. communis PSN243]